MVIASIAHLCFTTSEIEKIPPIYLQNTTEFRLGIGNPKECDPPFNDHGFVTKGVGYCTSFFGARGFCKLNCINECNTTTLTSVYCPELIRKVPGTFKSELVTLVCLCNGTDNKGRPVVNRDTGYHRLKDIDDARASLCGNGGHGNVIPGLITGQNDFHGLDEVVKNLKDALFDHYFRPRPENNVERD